MSVATGYNPKQKWMEMPEECFEVLTFGELKVGQQFIALPMPGDNDGHGGFRGTHCLFTKTHERVGGPGHPVNVPYHKDFPHGRAINNKHQTSSDVPLSMPVILIE
jgi:hypothetical protein